MLLLYLLNIAAPFLRPLSSWLFPPPSPCDGGWGWAFKAASVLAQHGPLSPAYLPEETGAPCTLTSGILEEYGQLTQQTHFVFSPVLTGCIYSIEMKFKCLFNIKTVTQLFLSRRVITCSSFKCAFMNCMNSLTLWNLLSPCWLSKYGLLDVVIYIPFQSLCLFQPILSWKKQEDTAGKVWTCRNTANPIIPCPSLWNFKFNMPSLFHYFSK